ncbi:hypothetical protein T484DRAFT_1880774, partial [Baffinella frigidus]
WGASSSPRPRCWRRRSPPCRSTTRATSVLSSASCSEQSTLSRRRRTCPGRSRYCQRESTPLWTRPELPPTACSTRLPTTLLRSPRLPSCLSSSSPGRLSRTRLPQLPPTWLSAWGKTE